MYASLSLSKIKKTCELLLKSSVSCIERAMPLYAVELDDYKEAGVFPEGGYIPFKSVSGKDKRYVIKLDLRTPAVSCEEDLYIEVRTGGERVQPA